MVRNVTTDGLGGALISVEELLKARAAHSFRRGDFLQASAELCRYCMVCPDDPAGYQNLLALSRRSGAPVTQMVQQTIRAQLLQPSGDAPLISLLTGLADRGFPLPAEVAPFVDARPLTDGLACALAILHHRSNAPKCAVNILKRGLVQNPGQPSLLRQYGTILNSSGDQASGPLFAWTLCCSLPGEPDFIEALRNVAAQCHAGGELVKAVRLYRDAVKAGPASMEARANLAAALVDSGEGGDAEKELRQLLVIDPGHRDGLWLSSCLRIGAGDGRTGYRAHHVRWTEPHSGARTLRFENTPLWLGQPPEGRRILIWGDFGIGDEIIFAPLASWLASQGASVVLEVDPRLVALAARSFPTIDVVGRDSEDPLSGGDFDYHAPSALLARFYDAHHSRTPLPVWRADQERSREIRESLHALAGGAWAGLAWGGGGKRTTWSKSTGLDDWSELLNLSGLNLVSLQYDGAAAGEEGRMSLLHEAPVADLRNDLDGLAALLQALDCTISISGINAHMAGALGRPGHVLLPKLPLWFWGRSGSKSSWYPNLTLYRNDGGGWGDPIAALTREVRRSLSL